MKSKKLLITILILLLLGAGCVYAWMHFSRPIAVTGVVKRGAAEKISPANIVVTESFTMDIKSEVGGRILTDNVHPGQAVKARDVLYIIDPKDLQIANEKSEADYKILKDRIALGSPLRFDIAANEENVRNVARYVEQGRRSQQELDGARRALDLLNFRFKNEEIDNQQRLNDIENLLKTQRRQLEKTSVTVAKDGSISEILKRAGDLVGAGEVLCRVISRERLVQAQIREENFAGIHPGLPVTLTFLGYGGGKPFHGTIERVLPSVDEATKRYIAYLKVDIPDDQLAQGLTGEASIMVDRHENALVIEKRALLGNSVFVVRDGRAVLVPVSVGFTGLDQAEILSGLKEGDLIILETPASFHNGERVRMVKSQ